MFTFKTRPTFNIKVKEWINLLPAVVFLELSSFHPKTLVMFRNATQ